MLSLPWRKTYLDLTDSRIHPKPPSAKSTGVFSTLAFRKHLVHEPLREVDWSLAPLVVQGRRGAVIAVIAWHASARTVPGGGDFRDIDLLLLLLVRDHARSRPWRRVFPDLHTCSGDIEIE